MEFIINHLSCFVLGKFGRQTNCMHYFGSRKTNAVMRMKLLHAERRTFYLVSLKLMQRAIVYENRYRDGLSASFGFSRHLILVCIFFLTRALAVLMQSLRKNAFYYIIQFVCACNWSILRAIFHSTAR